VLLGVQLDRRLKITNKVSGAKLVQKVLERVRVIVLVAVVHDHRPVSQLGDSHLLGGFQVPPAQ